MIVIIANIFAAVAGMLVGQNSMKTSQQWALHIEGWSTLTQGWA